MKTSFNFVAALFALLIIASFVSPDLTAQRKKNQVEINHDSIVIATYGKPVYGTEQYKKIQEIAKVLNKAAGLTGSSIIKFKLIQNEEINAFAYINDSIYVHTGLFKSVGNSIDQLAFVLAHELAHVLMKHPAKGDEFLNKNPNATEEQFLKLSREMEFEADKYAVLYTMRAGYSPLGGIEWFNFMTNQGYEYTPHTMSYVTHPNFTARVVEVFKHIATYYEYARNFEFGLIYLNSGDYKNSITAFNKFISAYPNFKEGYNNLAVAVLSQKLNQKGIQLEVLLPTTLSKVDFFTNIFTVNTKRGEYNLKNAELAEAEKALTKALELDPKYIQAYVNLAVLNTLTKNTKAATEAITKAESVSKKSYDVMIAKGFLQLELNKYKEAADIFKTANTTDPSRPEALYNMGLAYTYGQMKNEAISTWKNFIQKFKDSYYAQQAKEKLDVLEGKKAPTADKKKDPAPKKDDRPNTRPKNKFKAGATKNAPSLAGLNMGMSQSDVLNKLKLPASKTKDEYGDIWSYDTPAAIIYFDSDNKVVGVVSFDPSLKLTINGKSFSVNDDLQDALNLLGEASYVDDFGSEQQLVFEDYGVIIYAIDGIIAGIMVY
ncbi:MAG: M48 family metalloprotease [Ignavibacteria bacterium]|nr:M48 family metalloprotease [Ignavibacteria bacterium]